MQSEAIRSNLGRLVGEPFLGSEGLPCEAIRGDQRLCSEAVEADSRPSWDPPEARA